MNTIYFVYILYIARRTYQLLGEVNGSIMVARLLALTAAAEHADPLEPTTGLHHLSPGRPSRCLGGFSSLRTTPSTGALYEGCFIRLRLVALSAAPAPEPLALCRPVCHCARHSNGSGSSCSQPRSLVLDAPAGSVTVLLQ